MHSFTFISYIAIVYGEVFWNQYMKITGFSELKCPKSHNVSQK